MYSKSRHPQPLQDTNGIANAYDEHPTATQQYVFAIVVSLTLDRDLIESRLDVIQGMFYLG
jgi:hypothetical protein